MRILISLLFFLSFTFLSYSQCIEADVSVTRTCVDGTGNITILTNDPDSVTYSIDGGATFSNSPAFPNLNIGTYNIVIMDTTGCTVNLTTEIEEFLEVGPVAITTSCANNTGEIVIEGIKGKPIYDYSFDGGQSFFPDSNLNEIGAGVYHIVIKDSYGCEVDTMITVDAYPTISPTITTVNEQCNGSGPGSVDFSFTDGANYQYSLDGATTTSGTNYNNTNLLAGFYVLEVTDVNGCTSPFQFEIGADLVDDSVQINHEFCHYENGEITVFGFLGIAPYEYSIDNGTTYLPSGTFNDLAHGDHIVLIKDATGCIKTDSVYVTNFGGIITTPSLEDTVCSGSSAIVSVAHNGGINATYEWNNGLSNIQTHSVTPSITTVYSVIVTDSYGCKDTSETTIYVELIPTVSISETQLQACIGDSIQLTAFGATDYLWSTGDTTDEMNYVAVGNETITVTGYNGQCSDSEQMVIIIKPSPTAIANSNANSINTGDSIFFYSDGSITSTTTWNFGDGFSSMESNPHHTFDFPGAYYVVLTSEMGGCEAMDTILVYVGTVSISEIEKMNVLVYPNPTQNKFTLNSNKDNSQLYLYNIKGDIVKTKEISKGANIVFVENLSNGIYIGKVLSQNKVYQFKLIID